MSDHQLQKRSGSFLLIQASLSPYLVLEVKLQIGGIASL